jgi:hypothetical protein
MKYLMTLKIPFEGIDDVEARGLADHLGTYLKEAMSTANAQLFYAKPEFKPEYKFQKLQDGKPPEGMKWEIEKPVEAEVKVEVEVTGA